MYTHIYTEGIGKKGSNNVASLIVKTLEHLGLLRDNDPGGELTIVFDNCQGQNKNNTVLKLVPYLVELGYFKRINFVFLIVGHTKNSADAHFTCLKMTYHKADCFVLDDLLKICNHSEKVTVIPAVEEDLCDWGKYLSLFYRNFVKKVKINHIFTAATDASRRGNKMIVEICKSGLPHHSVDNHDCVKQGFWGRNNYKSFKEAVEMRPKLMLGGKAELLVQLEVPGLNIYKQVELYKNFRPLVPQSFWSDPFYARPDFSVMEAVKNEKKSRKEFRQELNEQKRKTRVKAKVEKVAEVGRDRKEEEKAGSEKGKKEGSIC